MSQKLRYGVFSAVVLFIAIRIPFFFDLPHLSDDFYRFMWDGMLLNEGLNPIGRIPVDQHLVDFKDPAFAEMLLSNMNSPNYASVYPTFHQAFFGFAYFFSGSKLLTGVNCMRAFIVIAELLFFLILLLRGRDNEQNYIYLFLLNPLVVVEGVGNLHFEVVMMPFIAIALIDFSPVRYLRSSVPLAGAILVKLTPAILGPLFLFRTKPKFRFYFLWSLAFMLFIFLGMLEPWTLFTSFNDGIGLYFGSFEFNASVYYLFTNLVSSFIGYNAIAILAPILAIVSLCLITFVSWYGRNSNIFEVALVVFLIYLLLSTTVHPWYIIPVVYLAIRSHRELILIWSFTAIFSYTHYIGDVGPKWIFISLEYGLLLLAIIVEGRKRRWLQSAFLG